MKTKSTLGSALILTTILLFVILGMVVSLTYVTVMEQKMSQKTKSSVGSFYNAESGVEWILNKIASSSGEIGDTLAMNSDFSVSCPPTFGDNDCKIYLLDQDGNVIQDSTADFSEIKAVRSVGSQGQDTQRAIEAAVAASGGACFTYYCNDSGNNICTNTGGTQGYCPAGFKQIYDLGSWGFCTVNATYPGDYFFPPGGNCNGNKGNIGRAYVCCQN